MSVLGIDIGNAFCVVAAAGKGSIDVVLNEESKRETPACVAIGERQRLLGAGAALATPGITVVSQIKRFIGRPFRDPALRTDLNTVFPNLKVSEDALGYPLIHFNYRGAELKLHPTQLLGMLLGGLKRSAERHLQAPVSDCCIAVPAHFNVAQRRAVLQAAEIAGLRPLRLLHECSAAAFEYGFYRWDTPVDREARPHVVAFVDVGHSASQVAVVQFRAQEIRILARAAESDLGGRDFDEKLFNYFANKLKSDDPELNVIWSARVATRLRTACEKVKKVLSTNPEAPLNIECFIEDKDASGLIKREEFESICEPLLQALKDMLQKALHEAKLNATNVDAVELIGSGSRVPAVFAAVREVFKQEPRRTLNASESVARGCALQAAMLSPSFKVKKQLMIHECVPCAIDIFLNDPVSEESASRKATVGDQTKEDGLFFDLAYRYATDNQVTGSLSAYRVGPFNFSQNGTAKLKITFHLSRNGIVLLDSVSMLPGKDASKSQQEPTDYISRMRTYENRPSYPSESGNRAETPEEMHTAPSISDSANAAVMVQEKPSVAPFKLIQNARAECIITFKLIRDGTVTFNDCKLTTFPVNDGSKSVEETTDDGSGKDIEEDLFPQHSETGVVAGKHVVVSVGMPDGRHQKSKEGNKSKDNLKSSMDKESSRSSQESAGDGRTGDVNGETYSISTQGHRPVNSPSCEEEEVRVSSSQGVLFREGLNEEKRLESEMAARDRAWEDLKTYVYEMNRKLGGEYREFVYDTKKVFFLKKLQQAERLLYNQRDNVDRDTFIRKLNELKTHGDPIEMRFRERSEWDAALEQLLKCLSDMEALANGDMPESAHIDKQGKEKIRNECEMATQWLKGVLRQRGKPKYVDQVFKTAEVQMKIDSMTSLRKLLTEKYALASYEYAYEMEAKGHRQVNPPPCEEQEVGVPFIEYSRGAFSREGLNKAKRRESDMAARDREVEDVKNQKNAVETYVYEMKSKLRGKYKEFVAEADKVCFVQKLEQAERWLYEEGDDVDRDSYIGKLHELKTHGDPIEMRFRERTEWEAALARLLTCLSDMEALANGDMPESAHIDRRGKEMIRNEWEAAKQWLNGVLQGQCDKPKHVDQVFETAQAQSKFDSMTSLRKYLTTEPRLGKKGAREKYALGSYAYEMEAKLRGEYSEFVIGTDRQYFIAELKKTVNELDYGVEATDPGAYVSRLKELKKLGDPIETRFREYTDSKEAISQLRICTDEIGRMLHSIDVKCGNNHSDNQEKLALQIQRDRDSAVTCLAVLTKVLKDRPKYEDPVVKVADMREATEYLLGLRRAYEALTSKSKSNFLSNTWTWLTQFAGFTPSPRGDRIPGNLPLLLQRQGPQQGYIRPPVNQVADGQHDIGPYHRGSQQQQGNMQPQLVLSQPANASHINEEGHQDEWGNQQQGNIQPQHTTRECVSHQCVSQPNIQPALYPNVAGGGLYNHEYQMGFQHVYSYGAGGPSHFNVRQTGSSTLHPYRIPQPPNATPQPPYMQPPRGDERDGPAMRRRGATTPHGPWRKNPSNFKWKQ